MSILTINETKCTRCNICVQSCPIAIISKRAEDYLPIVEVANESRCVYCGHCESVCPEGALTHKLSEQAINTSTERNVVIPSTDLGLYLKNRRSIRNYLSKTVPQETLEQIMDIVRYAPTGTNRQMNQWVVVSGAESVKKLTTETINWMRTLKTASPELAGRYNIQVLIDAFDKGFDSICRNAPHVFICITPSTYPIGLKDAVIATSHLEILLPSFGLGGCWAGFLMMALQNSPELKKFIDLDDSLMVHSALMVGYPKFKYYKTPPRNASNIKWI